MDKLLCCSRRLRAATAENGVSEAVKNEIRQPLRHFCGVSASWGAHAHRQAGSMYKSPSLYYRGMQTCVLLEKRGDVLAKHNTIINAKQRAQLHNIARSFYKKKTETLVFYVNGLVQTSRIC